MRRLLDIQIRRQALALPPLRQVERLLCGTDIFLLAGGQCLRAAKLDVGLRHLPLQHHQRVVGSLRLRLGRWPSPAPPTGGRGQTDRVPRTSSGRTGYRLTGWANWFSAPLTAELAEVPRPATSGVLVGQANSAGRNALRQQQAAQAQLLAHVATGAVHAGRPAARAETSPCCASTIRSTACCRSRLPLIALLDQRGQRRIVEAVPPFRIGVGRVLTGDAVGPG